MLHQKILKAAQKLEDPNHPLLGPNLKGLYLFGLWQIGSKYRNFLFNVIHLLSIIFVVTQFIDLYQTRRDLMKVFLNLSVSGFSLVAINKTLFFIYMHSKWADMVRLISTEEISQIKKNEPISMKIMTDYKKYCRTITYTYWFLLFITNIITMLTPALIYVSYSEYRADIRNGTEPYPYIVSSWFPFNKDQMPGYLVATVVHLCMVCQGTGVIATYDANAVIIMVFLKGQTLIVREKCKIIFGENEPIPKKEIFSRIKECNRHHNIIKKVFTSLNSLISPVMFIYVLICSITICCGVVQLTSEEVTISQKLWVIEFLVAETFQLFMYCWHSNEIALETDAVSRGIFESKYWRSDLKERKLLLLLAEKLGQPSILQAGPFTNLTILTFTQIMKGSYSFYTLFTQMQEPRT